MTKYSIIQKSQLEGADRLDAEYYQPEYLQIRKTILNLAHISLGEVSSRFKKGIFDIKADTYQESGIPFVRISNLKQCLIDEEGIAFISHEINKKEKATSLRKGDIVLSKTAYPAASLVTSDNVNISQDIIGISLRSDLQKKLTPEFIVIFLNSKYGLQEMQQWFQGNIQMHLSLPDAKTILIPLLSSEFQHQIVISFNQSYSEIENSRIFYQQAENLLLGEFGLNDIKFDDELSFVVNFSDVEKANRIDAEFFPPKYILLNEKLKKHNLKVLSDVVQNIAPTFNPYTRQNDTFHYVELSNIDPANGIIDGSTEVLGKEAPSRAKRILIKGDVIVSNVEGSLGKVALVTEEQNQYLASTGFFQFRSKHILPEVLLILAKSVVLRMQLQKYTAGTILSAVPADALNNIFIPILPQSTQQKIADLVRKSHEARKKSKELLEEAKHKVEEMIEKGI